ncbi:hypothetical protein JCM11641_002697 [Rhodosporidiobolus odoratus]
MAKVSYPHYAWAGGHFIVLASSLYTFLGLITFSTRDKSYYVAYAGALISWGIVVYKSLGPPTLSRAWLQRALLDENVQYLLLAGWWFVQKPITLTLLPFCTFSLFHTLTFLRTSVLPKVPSPTPGQKKSATGTPAATATASGVPDAPGVKVSRGIQTWVKAHYEQAMLFVAFIEVVGVFGRLLLGAITFQNSLLSPLFFAHFLRLRYYLSPPTRQAFAWVNGQIDEKVVKNSKVPQGVRKGVGMGRELIARYAESIISVQQPQPGAGAAEAHRAR